MKKMNNKGFSLVELIIVIAIMAILAGAIAPALIRYIDKSRKSNDVSSGKAIKTAIESAMTDEDIYAYLTSGTDSQDVEITVQPGEPTSGENENNNTDPEAKDTGAIEIAHATVPNDAPADIDAQAKTEIGTNIGEKTPKIKYKKDGANAFKATISKKGTITVYAISDSEEWELCPEVSKKYSK